MPGRHVSFPNHEGHEAHEGLQHEAFDSILQLCDVEVDNQPDRNFRQSHVRKNLRLMNREQSFNAFDFYNQVATYEQLDSVTAIEHGLSPKVIGCALEVHRNLGPGLLESTSSGPS